MNTETKRLRTIITFLTVALLSALGVLGVMVYRYKQMDTTLTKCYAVADASVWTLSAIGHEDEGYYEEADYAWAQSDAALSAVGEDRIIEAMERCDARFLLP
jgi:hypothetical protein